MKTSQVQKWILGVPQKLFLYESLISDIWMDSQSSEMIDYRDPTVQVDEVNTWYKGRREVFFMVSKDNHFAIQVS